MWPLIPIIAIGAMAALVSFIPGDQKSQPTPPRRDDEREPEPGPVVVTIEEQIEVTTQTVDDMRQTQRDLPFSEPPATEIDPEQLKTYIFKLIDEAKNRHRPIPDPKVELIGKKLLVLGETHPEQMVEIMKAIKRKSPGLIRRIGGTNQELVELYNEIMGL